MAAGSLHDRIVFSKLLFFTGPGERQPDLFLLYLRLSYAASLTGTFWLALLN